MTAQSRQVHALSHPLRARIVEMSKQNANRSLAAADLHAELSKTNEFGELSVEQVGYHVDILERARLIPSSQSREP